jgi:UDP-N-acetylglucosamine diphosphorylase / glucose-1-phosphate thymidylyltransferase / UDP-N-acetylgalactosamine diphosphorylase / glucosamine-1-phosphate N-acetyltransferase / galactosamine-1-phosphate N-acetyltransferase
VLAPLTGLRACFDVRTGALTTLERLRLVLGSAPMSLWVPESMTALTRQSHATPVNGTLNLDGPVLLYNGRCAIPPTGLAGLAPGTVLVEAGSGDLVAACASPRDVASLLREGRIPAGTVTEVRAPALMSRPWHARTFRDAALAMDLDLLLKSGRSEEEELFERPKETPTLDARPGALRMGGFPITVRGGAKVYPGAILDAEAGPIYIAERAMVRPGAIIIGPAYVGPGSAVLERATIRGGTAIGPSCKVNGEVGGTIFQGFANKAHDGYLGDSWVGEWVNLGAGTTNSNLLNTYGEVPARATPGGGHERTGQKFLGAIIGDHVKTAICTRIMTGSVLGVGGMFAATAPVSGCTPAFCWRTDEGERTYRLEKFVEVARAMMERRNVHPTEAYLARLGALHAAAGK